MLATSSAPDNTTVGVSEGHFSRHTSCSSSSEEQTGDSGSPDASAVHTESRVQEASVVSAHDVTSTVSASANAAADQQTTNSAADQPTESAADEQNSVAAMDQQTASVTAAEQNVETTSTVSASQQQNVETTSTVSASQQQNVETTSTVSASQQQTLQVSQRQADVSSVDSWAYHGTGNVPGETINTLDGGTTSSIADADVEVLGVNPESQTASVVAADAVHSVTQQSVHESVAQQSSARSVAEQSQQGEAQQVSAYKIEVSSQVSASQQGPESAQRGIADKDEQFSQSLQEEQSRYDEDVSRGPPEDEAEKFSSQVHGTYVVASEPQGQDRHSASSASSSSECSDGSEEEGTEEATQRTEQASQQQDEASHHVATAEATEVVVASRGVVAEASEGQMNTAAAHGVATTSSRNVETSSTTKYQVGSRTVQETSNIDGAVAAARSEPRLDTSLLTIDPNAIHWKLLHRETLPHYMADFHAVLGQNAGKLASGGRMQTKITRQLETTSRTAEAVSPTLVTRTEQTFTTHLRPTSPAQEAMPSSLVQKAAVSPQYSAAAQKFDLAPATYAPTMITTTAATAYPTTITTAATQGYPPSTSSTYGFPLQQTGAQQTTTIQQTTAGAFTESPLQVYSAGTPPPVSSYRGVAAFDSSPTSLMPSVLQDLPVVDVHDVSQRDISATAAGVQQMERGSRGVSKRTEGSRMDSKRSKTQQTYASQSKRSESQYSASIAPSEQMKKRAACCCPT